MNITGIRTVAKEAGQADPVTPGFPLYALSYSRFGYALLSMGHAEGKPGREKRIRRMLGYNDGFFTTAFW